MDGSSWWRESARPAAEAWRKSSAWTRWLSKDSASLAVEERPWIGARRASMVAEVPPPGLCFPPSYRRSWEESPVQGKEKGAKWARLMDICNWAFHWALYCPTFCYRCLQIG